MRRLPQSEIDEPPHGELSRGRIRHLRPERLPLHHRSGWNVAISHLGPLLHRRGVLFDGSVDNTYSWELPAFRNRLPFNEPWIGVVHNPPAMPEGQFPATRPQRYCTTPLFEQSLEQCRGLFALSAYQAEWFRRLSVPVEVTLHPTNFDVPPFRWELYAAARPRRVLHVGWWLRRLRSFGEFVAPDHRKVLLRVPNANAERAIDAIEWQDVTVMPYQSPLMYDRMLQQSVVFMHLIDASANNAVLDCIARATPLLINRHPAVEEYLGADYPLFWDTIEQATDHLRSDDRLFAAHRHLANPAFRQPFSGETFADAIRTSAIYRGLPLV